MGVDPIRVLLVEDNRGDAVLLQELLNAQPGYFAIAWADRLGKAVDLAGRESFDAVLLDLSLPDSSGTDTLAGVLRAMPSVAVVVVTGLADEAVAIRAIRGGAQDYLVKDGLTGLVVARSIKYAIDRKRAERRFRILSETAGRLLAAEDPRAVVEDVCTEVMRQLDCQLFACFLAEEDGGGHSSSVDGKKDGTGGPPAGERSPVPHDAPKAPMPRLRLNAFAGIPDDVLQRSESTGRGAYGSAVRDRARVAVEGVASGRDPGVELAKACGVQAYCCHPLLAQGRVIGTLAFGTRTRARFSDEDMAVMKTVADQVAVAMQRLLNLQEIERAKVEWERTFDSVPDLIAILDERQRIVRVNKAMADRLNRLGADCVGLPCFRCLHDAKKPLANCPHKQTVADGREHVAEIHEECLGGDFLISTSPLRDAGGRMLGVVHVARDITERRRFETQLAESERRYRNLFTHMSEGFALHEILCDERGEPVDYRFLDVNPGYERITGLSRDRLLGRTALEVTPGLERFWVKNYGQVALTGHPRRFENFNPGAGRWFESYAYRPAERQFAVILTDVTDVVRAREREKEAMATMTAARTAMDTLEAMGEGLVVADRKGMIRSMNPAMARLTGYNSDEIVGKSLAEFVPFVVEHEDLSSVMGKLEAALKGEAVAMLPLTLVAKDGRRIAVAPALSFIRGPGGRVDGIVLTVRDVSELREAHRAMEESERKYREVVEHANSIIMRRRADGTITFFNEYAQKFFGFAADEVLGRNVLGTIVPAVDSAGRNLAAMVRDISENPDQHASNENENICRDGRRVWVHWTNRAVRDAGGNVRELLCVGSDVTARKIMEAENRRYQERLRSLAEKLAVSEEQDRWRISRYIHDTIVQNLSLSSVQLGSLAGRLGDLDMGEEQGRVGQTRRLVDQAIEECRMVMSDLTPSLLYELGLVAALNELAQRLEEKHMIRVRIEDEGQDVAMENSLRGLLFESTRELVMNALKHAGPCEVRVIVRRCGNDVVISVADNGKGFDSAAVDARSVRHGGFGLFNIRQRVEGLGGRVDVESVPGKGTTATIRVPAGAGDGGSGTGDR